MLIPFVLVSGTLAFTGGAFMAPFTLESAVNSFLGGASLGLLVGIIFRGFVVHALVSTAETSRSSSLKFAKVAAIVLTVAMIFGAFAIGIKVSKMTSKQENHFIWSWGK